MAANLTPSTDTVRSRPMDPTTSRLLAAGQLAGPIFVFTAAVQAVTRHGFDLSHHPLSLLTLGDLGWIQIANFILAGTLCVAFAVGVGRRLTGGPGRVWAPRLFGGFGAGLILGGAFVPDAALGYPVGTPDAIPSTLSGHGMVHAVAPPLAFLSLVAVCFVVARRLSARRMTDAAVGTRVIGLVCLLLSLPVGPALSVRLFVAVAVGFAWITWFGAYLRRDDQV